MNTKVSYQDILSPTAKKVLETQYGETGYKYAGIANWKTIFRLLWLFLVRGYSPIEAIHLTNHPAQLHYGITKKGNWHNFNESVRNATRFAYKALNLPQKALILNAGSGWGGTELQLVKEHQQLKTVGVTIDKTQAEIARTLAQLKGLEDKCHFQIENYLELPTEWNNKFNACLAIETLCHIPANQTHLAFKSFHRVLKPKSRLLVHDWFVAKKLSSKEKNDVDQFLKGWDIVNLPSVDSYLDIAKSTGFTKISIKKITAEVMPSARAIYWRGKIFEPIIKLLQGVKIKKIKQLGLHHLQILDFVLTCQLQLKLYQKGLIDYYQLVFEK